MVRLLVLIVVVFGAICPAAQALPFAAPDSRAVTLAPDNHITAIAALPGGGAVYATQPREGDPGRVMWLRPDGVLRTVRRRGADVLAAEPSGTVLVVDGAVAGQPSERRIRRLSLASGRSTTLVTVGEPTGSFGMQAIDAMTVVGNGTIIVGAPELGGLWKITPRGTARRLRIPSSGTVFGMAALPGREFAYLEGWDLIVADTAGHHRVVPGLRTTTPIAASGDGGIVAGVRRADDASPGASVFARVAPDGSVVALTPSDDRLGPRPFLGVGDGLPLASLWDDAFDPVAMAVASDGSLLFANASPSSWEQRFEAYPVETHPAGLRAIVPAASARPRVTFTRDTFESFPAGRVSYVAAGARGNDAVATMSVLRGDAVVATARAPVPATGAGEVALAQPVPPGRYEVRLRFTSPAGGGAQTSARIDTRAWLPTVEARRFAETMVDEDGDEGYREGTIIGDCQRVAALVVRCVVVYHRSGIELWGPHEGEWSETTEPARAAVVTLARDGLHEADEQFPDAEPQQILTASNLRVSAGRRVSRRGRLAMRVRVARPGDIRITGAFRWTARGSVHRRRTVVSWTLPAGATWRPAVQLPRDVQAALREGRRVRAKLTTRLEIATSHGVRRETYGIPVTLRR